MDKLELEAAMTVVDQINSEFGEGIEDFDLLPYAELRTSGDVGRIELCGVEVWCSEDCSLLEEGEFNGLDSLKANVGKLIRLMTQLNPEKIVSAIKLNNGQA